jgi:hypothetical protein
MTIRRSRSSSLKSLSARLSAMPMISEPAAGSPNAIWYSTGIQQMYSPCRFSRWKSWRLRKLLIVIGHASPVPGQRDEGGHPATPATPTTAPTVDDLMTRSADIRWHA